MVVRFCCWLAALIVASGCAVTAVDIRRLGERGDIEELLRVLRETDRDSIRRAVIEALTLHPGDARGLGTVLRLAEPTHSLEVRTAAVKALGSFEGAEVCAALVAALADVQPSIRDAARTVLNTRGDVAEEPLMKAAASDANHQVRAAALRLLTTQADRRPALRARVEELLQNGARGDESPKVREAAVNGLGKLGVESARRLLSEMRRTDPDAGVRMKAELALQKLERPGESQVVVAVLPLKNDTGLDDSDLARLGVQVAEYVSARLSAAQLCQVVDRRKLEEAMAEMKKIGKLIYDGNTPNAPEFGRFKIANQLVYGSIQRQGSIYTILLNRMDVSTLQLIPGAAATVSGERADFEQLKVKVTDLFLSNFRP